MKLLSQFTQREIHAGLCFLMSAVPSPQGDTRYLRGQQWQRHRPVSHLPTEQSRIQHLTFSSCKQFGQTWPYTTAVLLSNEMDAAIQLSASFVCGRRENQTSGARTHHSSIFQIAFGSTQHTIAFLQCSEEPDGFKKTHFASKVAYGILINNRLIDLSPLKNLIWLLAHLLVPGKCYKTRVALDQPCHPSGDILHGPPGDHIWRRWQTEEPQRRFSCL